MMISKVRAVQCHLGNIHLNFAFRTKCFKPQKLIGKPPQIAMGSRFRSLIYFWFSVCMKTLWIKKTNNLPPPVATPSAECIKSVSCFESFFCVLIVSTLILFLSVDLFLIYTTVDDIKLKLYAFLLCPLDKSF